MRRSPVLLAVPLTWLIGCDGTAPLFPPGAGTAVRPGSGGMTYSWRIGGQEVGTDDFLYWYTGTFGFQITLIGAAGDGQVDTAAVSVSLNKNAPSCLLKRG